MIVLTQNIAKDEQQELSRYLLFLENAVEEVECDIKEAEVRCLHFAFMLSQCFSICDFRRSMNSF